MKSSCIIIQTAFYESRNINLIITNLFFVVPRAHDWWVVQHSNHLDERKGESNQLTLISDINPSTFGVTKQVIMVSDGNIR
jgi:hypothetical protein